MAQHESVARIEALYRNEWPGSATTGPAAYSDFWDGGGEKLEFLADAGRKPRSVRFHTVRAVVGVVRCPFERVSARPDSTGQSNEPARYRRLPAVVCRTIGARARTADREGLIHRAHWSELAAKQHE